MKACTLKGNMKIPWKKPKSIEKILKDTIGIPE
jgi:hypothetical protein